MFGRCPKCIREDASRKVADMLDATEIASLFYEEVGPAKEHEVYGSQPSMIRGIGSEMKSLPRGKSQPRHTLFVTDALIRKVADRKATMDPTRMQCALRRRLLVDGFAQE